MQGGTLEVLVGRLLLALQGEQVSQGERIQRGMAMLKGEFLQCCLYVKNLYVLSIANFFIPFILLHYYTE